MYDLPLPEDDGLYIPPPVGEWSREKYYFLRRYIDAFTNSMHDKPWSALHYIDLFAGAGIVRLEDSGDLEWGSPLIAALVPNIPFSALHFCELEKRRCDALVSRLQRLRPKRGYQILHGDANQLVHQVVDHIPQRALSLAFLDPYGLHLHFETIEALAKKRVDLIIFFPDHLDALRNCEYVYRDDPSSNLDRVLGPGADWRGALDKTSKDRWSEVLRDLYCKQIKSIGYKEFEFERIHARGHPLYLLIFCSRHPLAAKIWRGIASKKPDDQRTFDFGIPE